MAGARRRSTARRRAVQCWVLLCLAATLLGGCTVGPSRRPALATIGPGGSVAVPGPTAASVVPTGPGGAGRTADPITWAACPSQIRSRDAGSGRQFTLQCADVDVPKSYADAASGTISVAVSRARAAGTPANAPPLLVMLDSPGRSGTQQIAAVAGALPSEVLAHFAVVVTDPRGTGDSSPIDCVSGPNSGHLLALGADPTTATAATLLTGLSRALTFDCGDMVGPDLSDYGTVPAADDLDTVRAALGRPTIDLVGRGTGATLAAVYADRYPGRVGHAVLDGPGDPALPPDRQALAAAAAQQQALASFAAACPAFAGGCPLGNDPVRSIQQLITATGDVGASDSDGQQITGGSIVQVLVDDLGDPQLWPALASALAAARTGNPDPVGLLLGQALGTPDVARQQAGALIYRCNDSGQRLDGTALVAAVRAGRAQSPIFAPYLLGLVGVCAAWPAPETALGAVTAAGAPPILVVGGVDDPVSPFAAVRSVTAQLNSAVLLSWQSGTHGAYPASACVTTAVDRYLLAGALPAPGTLCPP